MSRLEAVRFWKRYGAPGAGFQEYRRRPAGHPLGCRRKDVPPETERLGGPLVAADDLYWYAHCLRGRSGGVAASAGRVRLAPASVAFLAFPGAKNAVCE